MERQFLYTDQSSIDSNTNYVENAISIIYPYFERYKTLNLPELTSEDLEEFIKNPKSFFVKILSNGETLKIGQMALDPLKLYDLLPIPEEVKQLADDLISFSGENSFNSYPLQYVSVSENELIVDPKYIADTKIRFTYYTENDDQNKALELILRIAEDLNTLKAIGKKPYFYLKNLIEDCFKEKEGNIVFGNIKAIRKF